MSFFPILLHVNASINFNLSSLIDDNSSTAIPFISNTSTSSRPINYPVLVLLIFPVFTVFGNILVCLSIYREKTLHTVTNYFIFSLALADILVGILVMPLAVYVEVNYSRWELGNALCDAWVAFDVMGCTSSILNLAAISVDRYIAVTKPIQYAKHKNSGRIRFTLALTWLVSIAVSLPIVLGINYTERRVKTPWLCTFYNADFIIYSSMTSFFFPCLLMVSLYASIFATLRRRAKAAIASKPLPSTETRKIRSKSACHLPRSTYAPVEKDSVEPQNSFNAGNRTTRYIKKIERIGEYSSFDERNAHLKDAVQINSGVFDANDDHSKKQMNCYVHRTGKEKNIGNTIIKNEHFESINAEGGDNKEKMHTNRNVQSWSLENNDSIGGTSSLSCDLSQSKTADEKRKKSVCFKSRQIDFETNIVKITSLCSGEKIETIKKLKKSFSDGEISTKVFEEKNKNQINCFEKEKIIEMKNELPKETHTSISDKNKAQTFKKVVEVENEIKVVREEEARTKKISEHCCRGAGENHSKLIAIDETEEKHFSGEFKKKKTFSKRKRVVSKRQTSKKTIKPTNQISKSIKKEVKYTTKTNSSYKKRKSISRSSFNVSKKSFKKRVNSTKAPVATVQKSQVTTGTTLLLVEAAESTLKTSATILAIQQLDRKTPRSHGKQAHSRLSDFGTRRSTVFNFSIKFNKLRHDKCSNRREKKATKTLAIVLAVFLVCWFPFFTLNIINAICIRWDLFQASVCHINPAAFSFVVWLGYLNSLLNPLIYTLFNVEFRKAFKKIFSCSSGHFSSNPFSW